MMCHYRSDMEPFLYFHSAQGPMLKQFLLVGTTWSMQLRETYAGTQNNNHHMTERIHIPDVLVYFLTVFPDRVDEHCTDVPGRWCLFTSCLPSCHILFHPECSTSVTCHNQPSSQTYGDSTSPLWCKIIIWDKRIARKFSFLLIFNFKIVYE